MGLDASMQAFDEVLYLRTERMVCDVGGIWRDRRKLPIVEGPRIML